jgi:GTP cyclohydrolase II
MTLKQIANVNFPTNWATFRLLGFEANRIDKVTGREFSETAVALVLGDVLTSPPIVRIHSQCTTGEVFHSLRCDCHDQLHLALKLIAEQGTGVLVYEQQEGRGIGLMEKLRAYELQDQGLDTVEANLCLGHAVDARNYALSVEVLRFLKIMSLRLISNNPKKVLAVLASGIRIVERIAADVPQNAHSSRYLATKRDKLGHLSRDLSGHSSDPFIRGNQSAHSALLPEAVDDTMDHDLGISAALGGD